MAFWGSFGLCGGMSWAALDRFFTGRPAPESNSIPGAPGQLFSELVVRQVDSMRGQQMLARCLTWQLLPDRSPWWMFWRDGVLEETGKRQWPNLKAFLDNGTPVSLTLIRVAGVANPSNNHQVVAIGYEEAADRTMEVKIYDPNHPGDAVSLHLRFDLRGRLQESSQTSGEPLRGFFVWDYSPPT